MPDKIILPCRYFFVERKTSAEEGDDRGENLYEEKDIKVAVEGVREEEGGRFCRAWTEVFGVSGGGFIVRYRFHQPCDKVKISVLIGGEHIEGSPIMVKGQVLGDHCVCPLPSLPDRRQNCLKCFVVKVIGCPSRKTDQINGSSTGSRKPSESGQAGKYSLKGYPFS